MCCPSSFTRACWQQPALPRSTKNSTMADEHRISEENLQYLRSELRPLLGVQFNILSLPTAALAGFEPSQIGTIVGTLMDACLPHLREIPQVGLMKHEGILGEREGYPDFKHISRFR